MSSIDVARAKADLYAAAGVPAFWLVLAEQETVEVYSHPTPGGYRKMETLRRGDTLETWYGTRIPTEELFA